MPDLSSTTPAAPADTKQVKGQKDASNPAHVSFYVPSADQQQSLAADGAINIKTGSAVLTKTSTGAFTLAAPVAGTDDGKTLRIRAATNFMHTVTTPSNAINGAFTTITFGYGSPLAPAVGLTATLYAFNGGWLVSPTEGVSLS